MNLLPPITPDKLDWPKLTGYIGFVHHHSFIADGIAWFTRWYRHDHEPSVSHVLGISGPNLCIEANADGVDEDSMDPYLQDPKCTVYLRKPLQWTPEIGARIVAKGREYVGCKYDDVLIVADALNNTLLGHALNGLTHDQIAKWLVKMMDDPKRMICSEVWDLAMAAQPEYAGLGTLKEPAAMNNPQSLFSDEEIFARDVITVKGI
jgi:hypothetical protein